MKNLIFMRIVVASIATGGVIFLAYLDKPGWGWLIVLAAFLGFKYYE